MHAYAPLQSGTYPYFIRNFVLNYRFLKPEILNNPDKEFYEIVCNDSHLNVSCSADIEQGDVQ